MSADDGSSHIVEVYGEALDSGDKGTAKAMSAAYKLAMLQAFCIPVQDSVDADSISHKLAAKSHAPEPVQGWEQWVRDINDIAEVCESQQAIDVVQDRNRGLLKSLSRERAPLYAELGECFAKRRQVLRDREKPRNRKSRRCKAEAMSPVSAEVAHG